MHIELEAGAHGLQRLPVALHGGRFVVSRRAFSYQQCKYIIQCLVVCKLRTFPSRKRLHNTVSCGMQTEDLSEQEKVTLEWDGMAGDWDGLARGYALSLYQHLVDSADFLPAANVICDFGCGTGLLTEQILSEGSSSDTATTILAIDASPEMISVLKEKIRSRGWTNVQAVATTLGGPPTTKVGPPHSSAATAAVVDDFEGTVDLVVASSVMTFVPAADREATMTALARLLKPGGIFCHSDWPRSDQHPDGMTAAMAHELCRSGGLTLDSTREDVRLDMGGGECATVFIGVARKQTSTSC